MSQESNFSDEDIAHEPSVESPAEAPLRTTSSGFHISSLRTGSCRNLVDFDTTTSS